MTLFSLKTVNQLQSNATKPVLLKSSRSKLALVLVAGSIIFVVVTFNMNWGKVNAEKSVEDLRPLVKKATSNKEAALKYCPLLIKKLEKNHSLAELILECIIIAKLNPEKSAHEIIKEAKKKWYK